MGCQDASASSASRSIGLRRRRGIGREPPSGRDFAQREQRLERLLRAVDLLAARRVRRDASTVPVAANPALAPLCTPPGYTIDRCSVSNRYDGTTMSVPAASSIVAVTSSSRLPWSTAGSRLASREVDRLGLDFEVEGQGGGNCWAPAGVASSALSPATSSSIETVGQRRRVDVDVAVGGAGSASAALRFGAPATSGDGDETGIPRWPRRQRARAVEPSRASSARLTVSTSIGVELHEPHASARRTGARQ